jgi:hypothetical protein
VHAWRTRRRGGCLVRAFRAGWASVRAFAAAWGRSGLQEASLLASEWALRSAEPGTRCLRANLVITLHRRLDRRNRLPTCDDPNYAEASSSHRRLDRRNRLPTCDDPNYAEARQRAQASIMVRNRPRRRRRRQEEEEEQDRFGILIVDVFPLGAPSL